MSVLAIGTPNALYHLPQRDANDHRYRPCTVTAIQNAGATGDLIVWLNPDDLQTGVDYDALWNVGSLSAEFCLIVRGVVEGDNEENTWKLVP